ncbi:hypothetical protein BKA82DRAFT_738725 [Pisolithus tinctorius]|uniref:Uncharacterized protein n=1 Tax=Pisolithus tinctorius Marx 270 TaxID=870435 RepID=A0A0C3JU75_PISTI|nr:hypothetical protein BKA82DRAFT_738725 [Pisolithus tinctorius]KIO01007.1 hypothetical protein M404DRAFT_738725 [Pisolithus tinctorius Marx 270]
MSFTLLVPTERRHGEMGLLQYSMNTSRRARISSAAGSQKVADLKGTLRKQMSGSPLPLWIQHASRPLRPPTFRFNYQHPHCASTPPSPLCVIIDGRRRAPTVLVVSTDANEPHVLLANALALPGSCRRRDVRSNP